MPLGEFRDGTCFDSPFVMISFDVTLTSGMPVSAAVCHAGCLVGRATVASRSGRAGNFGQHVMKTVVVVRRPKQSVGLRRVCEFELVRPAVLARQVVSVYSDFIVCHTVLD